jgi:hypothetical protein
MLNIAEIAKIAVVNSKYLSIEYEENKNIVTVMFQENQSNVKLILLRATLPAMVATEVRLSNKNITFIPTTTAANTNGNCQIFTPKMPAAMFKKIADIIIPKPNKVRLTNMLLKTNLAILIINDKPPTNNITNEYCNMRAGSVSVIKQLSVV